MPTGLAGPYSASSVMPATIVGSAKGRSMTALTRLRPRKSSRMRTQPTSVPITALMAATARLTSSVKRSADTAWRLLPACQNAPVPPSSDLATTAASGSSTMMLSHSVATPRPARPAAPGRDAAGGGRPGGPPAGRGRAPAPRGHGAAGSGRPRSLGRRHPRVLLDLGERPPVGVEELVVDLAPAADVVDRHELLGRRELGGVGLQDRLVDRPVAPLGELLLAGLAQRVLQERLGLRAGRLRHGDRVVDLERVVGQHVVDVLALLLRGKRLVLIGDEHVALAAGERLQRLAPRLRLDLDVLGQQLADA